MRRAQRSEEDLRSGPPGVVGEAAEVEVGRLRRRVAELELQLAQARAAVDSTAPGGLLAAPDVASERAGRLRQMQQADRLISLGTLVSGMAHEINNPNHFITLNMPILRKVWDDVRPILDQHVRQDPELTLANVPYSEMRQDIPTLIEQVMYGADRIRRIVSELRRFATVRGPEHMSPIAVNEAVRSALALLEGRLKKATDSFSVSYAEGLPDVVGNLRSLEQVVVNLVLNACEALSHRRATIDVSTEHDPAQGQVLLRVRDQGCGMEPEQLPHIKDPFFTTKREAGGTGLGLAVSNRIIEDHRGTLRFESELGRGTLAVVSLPQCARIVHDPQDGSETG